MPLGTYIPYFIANPVMAQHKLPPAESPANKIFLGLILK
jgi:hypothetical protein